MQNGTPPEKIKVDDGGAETLVLPVVSRTELSTRFFNAARMAISMSNKTGQKWAGMSPAIKKADTLDTIRVKVANFWGITENEWRHTHTRQSETKDLSTRTMTTVYEHEYESKRLNFQCQSMYADPRIPLKRLESQNKKAFALLGMADGKPMPNVVLDELFPSEDRKLIDDEDKWKQYLVGLSKSKDSLLRDDAVLSTYKLEINGSVEDGSLSAETIEELNYEGAHRLWELSFDVNTRAYLPRASLEVVIEGIADNSVLRVREVCAAALWSMMPSQHCRRVTVELKLLPKFLNAVAGIDVGDVNCALLLDRCIGAIAIMTVDRDCRGIIRDFEASTGILSKYATEKPAQPWIEETVTVVAAARDAGSRAGNACTDPIDAMTPTTEVRRREVLRQQLAANALASMLIRDSATSSQLTVTAATAKVVAAMCADEINEVREAGVLTIGSFGDQIEMWTENFDLTDAVDVMNASLKEVQQSIEEVEAVNEDHELKSKQRTKALKKKVLFLGIASKAVWVASSIVFAKAVDRVIANKVAHQILSFVHALRRLRASVDGTDVAISNLLFALTTLMSDAAIAEQAVRGESEALFTSLLEELDAEPDSVHIEHRSAAILGILTNIAQHSISEQDGSSEKAFKGTMKGSLRQNLLTHSVFKTVLKLLVRIRDRNTSTSELIREISSSLVMLLLTSIDKVDTDDVHVIMSELMRSTSSSKASSNFMTSLWLICRRDTEDMKRKIAKCYKDLTNPTPWDTATANGNSTVAEGVDGNGESDTGTPGSKTHALGDGSEHKSPTSPTESKTGLPSPTAKLEGDERTGHALAQEENTLSSEVGNDEKQVLTPSKSEDARTTGDNEGVEVGAEENEATKDEEADAEYDEEIQTSVFTFMFELGDRWMSILQKKVDFKHTEEIGCLLRFWVSTVWLFLIPANPRPAMPYLLRSFTTATPGTAATAAAAAAAAAKANVAGAPTSPPSSWWGVELSKSSHATYGGASQLPEYLRPIFVRVEEIITKFHNDETLDKVRALSICLLRAFLSFYDEYDTSAYSSRALCEKLLLISGDVQECPELRTHAINLLLDLSLLGVHLSLTSIIEVLSKLIRSSHESLQLTGARGIAFLIYSARNDSVNVAADQTGIVRSAWKFLINTVREWRREVCDVANAHRASEEGSSDSGLLQCLEKLCISMHAVVNLSIYSPSQVKMGASFGIMNLVELRNEVQTRRMRLRVPMRYRSRLDDVSNMLGYLLANLQSHPLNRTSMYKAELAYSTKKEQHLMSSGKYADDAMGLSQDGNLGLDVLYKHENRNVDGGKGPASFKTSENAARFLDWMEETFPSDSSANSFFVSAKNASSSLSSSIAATAATAATANNGQGAVGGSSSSVSGGSAIKSGASLPSISGATGSSAPTVPGSIGKVPSVASLHGGASSKFSPRTTTSSYSERKRIRGFNLKMCRPFRQILGIPTNLNLTTCRNPWEPSISDYREESAVVQLPEIANKLLTASKPEETTSKLSNAAMALADHVVSLDDVYHLATEEEEMYLDNVDVDRPVTPLNVVPLTLVKRSQASMRGRHALDASMHGREVSFAPSALSPGGSSVAGSPTKGAKDGTTTHFPRLDGVVKRSSPIKTASSIDTAAGVTSPVGSGPIAPTTNTSPSKFEAFEASTAATTSLQAEISGIDAYNSAAGDGVTGASMHDPRIKLKVNLQPRRARKCISFASNFDDGPGLHRFLRGSNNAAHLAIWEHVEGNKVYDNLFRKYNLPNGRAAYFYYRPGPLTDKIEVNIDSPLPRPTKLSLVEFQVDLSDVDFGALRDRYQGAGISLEGTHDDVMDRDDDTISLPHTSSPISFVHDDRIKTKPYCPHPRLADKPDVLVIDRKIEDMQAAKGTVFVECVILKKMEETKEFRDMDVVKPPWNIANSVFGPRKAESDSKSYFTTKELFNKMYQYEWEKLSNKNKFMNFLHRELKGYDVAQEIESIRRYLRDQWQILIGVFMYYSAQSGVGIFRMNWNSFTCFVEECSISDQESKFCQRKDVDTLFIMCNFQEDKKVAMKQMNQENELMPFEFMEVLIRLAVNKYYKPGLVPDMTQSIMRLIEDDVKPHLPAHVQQDQNDFRREYYYCEEMDDAARENQVMLKAVYKRYLMRPPQGGMRSSRMMFAPGFTEFINDAKITCESLTIRDINLLFTVSKMPVANYVKDWDKHTSLSYLDFLEVIARMSDYLSLPSYEQMHEAKYANVLDMFQDLERSTRSDEHLKIQRRESSYAVKGKDMSVHTRALAEKFQLLLDLIFRSLHETYIGGPYSADALLKRLQKIDANI